MGNRQQFFHLNLIEKEPLRLNSRNCSQIFSIKTLISDYFFQNFKRVGKEEKKQKKIHHKSKNKINNSKK